jgi:hypothetical protein
VTSQKIIHISSSLIKGSDHYKQPLESRAEIILTNGQDAEFIITIPERKMPIPSPKSYDLGYPPSSSKENIHAAGKQKTVTKLPRSNRRAICVHMAPACLAGCGKSGASFLNKATQTTYVKIFRIQRKWLALRNKNKKKTKITKPRDEFSKQYEYSSYEGKIRPSANAMTGSYICASKIGALNRAPSSPWIEPLEFLEHVTPAGERCSWCRSCPVL